jgi:hypothetical protein
VRRRLLRGDLAPLWHAHVRISGHSYISLRSLEPAELSCIVFVSDPSGRDGLSSAL